MEGKTWIFDGEPAEPEEIVQKLMEEIEGISDPQKKVATLEVVADFMGESGLSLDDVGLELAEITKIANSFYSGSSPEVMAKHKLVSNVIDKFTKIDNPKE